MITYPSNVESLRLGFGLLRESYRRDIESGKSRLRASASTMMQALIGIASLPFYWPILLRPNKRVFSRSELEAMLKSLMTGSFQIEEDTAYQDFIVDGIKNN